jgi:rhodanese-related sulfurtransferase
MALTLTAICVMAVLLSVLAIFLQKRRSGQRQIEQHSITAEELHSLLSSNQDTVLFDVRQPLDLLAHSEMIPGARRIPPAEVLARPDLIPRDKEAIVYCTCPGEKTSRAILGRALGLRFSKIKFLKGGLEAWKAKGYPVEPYREVFQLYTPNLVQH